MQNTYSRPSITADAEPATWRSDCTAPFYRRDLSILGFWYLQGLLEPIPRGFGYQGMTVHSDLRAFIFIIRWFYSCGDFDTTPILTPSGEPIGYKTPYILEYLHLPFWEKVLKLSWHTWKCKTLWKPLPPQNNRQNNLNVIWRKWCFHWKRKSNLQIH